MQMRRLGREGPELSVIGYGSWEAGGTEWGPNPSDEAVVAAIRAALDAGVNWIDTAEVYGRGRSEELVGRAIERRRDEVLIATKVAPAEEGSGVRPEEVHKAIRGSLQRLHVDHVDLYQVHWLDEDVPVEETWGAMADLVGQGMTRWIGVSNFERPEIERCLAVHPVTSVQNELSLVRRDDVEGGLVAWLAERGIGYLAFGPLGFGMLTGAIGADTVFAETDWRGAQRGGEYYEDGPFSPGAFESNLETLGGLQSVADDLEIPVATVALRWVLERKGVTAAIVGSRNGEHVRANARAGELSLDAATLRRIDALVGS
jgi:aryl-alcohol dehydrogenase-like predicted oxidoreductase